MADNASGTAAPAPSVDNSPSLASWIGEQFGNYAGDEPDETEGATPSPESEEPSTAEPEGEETSAEPSEEPSGEPAETAPDSAAPVSQEESDPLEGSSPLSYVVDGQTRSSDGITLLKDGGAIVDPDKVDWLKQRLSERDHLYEKDRALAHLSSWTYTGQDGRPVTLMGADAIRYRDQLLATAGATIKANEGLTNRVVEKIMQYVPDAFVKVDPNTNAVSWNPDALSQIRKMVDDEVAREAGLLNREYQLNASARYSQAQAQPETLTRESIQAAAPETVSQVLTALGITNLTAEDKADLAAILPDYVRNATRDDVARDPSLTVGRPFVDPRFAQFPRRLSAARGDAAKLVTSATKVDAKNAARLAAASQGKGGKAPARIPPQKEKQPTQQDNFDDAWERNERAAAGALRAHAAG